MKVMFPSNHYGTHHLSRGTVLRYHVVEVTWGYSIFTRIIIPLLSTRALTTFELAYRTFCFLVYDLSTLSVIKFTVNIISNDIENTVLKNDSKR